MIRNLLISFGFVGFGIFPSCQKHEGTEIDSTIILNQAAIPQLLKDEFLNEFHLIDFVYSADTLNRNVDLDSEELMDFLKIQLKSFDTLNTNKETVLYLKSLYLADFVFASFSHQFLGQELGLANDSLIRNKWEDYSMEEQFGFGNENQISFSCGTRSNFYLELIRTLLRLEGRDTSIKNVHTYPITTISGIDYIIDPSEPMVFISSRNSGVLKYNQLKNSSEVVIYSSKRSFGSSHFIFSNRLLNNIQPLSGELNEQILTYLENNRSLAADKVPACYDPYYKKIWNISYLNSENNSLAVPLFSRNIGTYLTAQNYKETYFGANCNRSN